MIRKHFVKIKVLFAFSLIIKRRRGERGRSESEGGEGVFSSSCAMVCGFDMHDENEC